MNEVFLEFESVLAVHTADFYIVHILLSINVFLYEFVSYFVIIESERNICFNNVLYTVYCKLLYVLIIILRSKYLI